MDKRKDSVIAYKKVSEKVAGSNPALTAKSPLPSAGYGSKIEITDMRLILVYWRGGSPNRRSA